jgi:tetratricopeptide (TPR) repeat protein
MFETYIAKKLYQGARNSIAKNHYDEAQEHANNGNYEEALVSIDKAINALPSNAGTTSIGWRYFKGKIYEAMEEWEKAVEVLYEEPIPYTEPKGLKSVRITNWKYSRWYQPMLDAAEIQGLRLKEYDKALKTCEEVLTFIENPDMEENPLVTRDFQDPYADNDTNWKFDFYSLQTSIWISRNDKNQARKILKKMEGLYSEFAPGVAELYIMIGDYEYYNGHQSEISDLEKFVFEVRIGEYEKDDKKQIQYFGKLFSRLKLQEDKLNEPYSDILARAEDFLKERKVDLNSLPLESICLDCGKLISSDGTGESKNLCDECDAKKPEETAEGCFIATAVSGSYNHPDVQTLRLVRDTFLLPSDWGNRIVQQYYRLSPPVANFLSGKPILCLTVYSFLIKPAAILMRIFLKTKRSKN